MYVGFPGIKALQRVFYHKFPTVFKLFRHRVNASSNFATVTFFTVFKMCRHRVNAVLDSMQLSVSEIERECTFSTNGLVLEIFEISDLGFGFSTPSFV